MARGDLHFDVVPTHYERGACPALCKDEALLVGPDGATSDVLFQNDTYVETPEREPTMKITALTNGPLLVEGPVPLIDQDGKEYAPKNLARFALCRCGASANKPFCDGTHAKNGFQSAPQTQKAEDPLMSGARLSEWENEGGVQAKVKE
jgi:CDGSH-type Zn-finger protein